MNVQGHDPALKTNMYLIMSEIIGYQHPSLGVCYYIVIHWAFFMPALEHHLVSPFQAPVGGITSNDCHKRLEHIPTAKLHCTVAEDEAGRYAVLPICLLFH